MKKKVVLIGDSIRQIGYGTILDQYLDKDEYDFNIKDLHYSKEIIYIIKKNLNILLEMIEKKQDPFNDECVYGWYEKYLEEEKRLK